MSPNLVSILASIAAAQARVAGMQAFNQHRISLGQSIGYDQDSFDNETAGLEHLAKAAQQEQGS